MSNSEGGVIRKGIKICKEGTVRVETHCVKVKETGML
jgi:hypothetical protein